MYATPALIAVAILAALVYLPKIRGPALWITLGLFGLSLIAIGIWFVVVTFENRRQAATNERDTSLLVDHVIGKPLHCKLFPFGTTPPGSPIRKSEEAMKRPVSGKKRTAEMLSDAELTELLRESDPLRPPADAEGVECREELKELRKLIKKSAYTLNSFIKNHQNDPRISAVQLVLAANDEEFEATCKDLVEQKKDDYELHRHGCKQ